jgi:hypothetical protein
MFPLQHATKTNPEMGGGHTVIGLPILIVFTLVLISIRLVRAMLIWATRSSRSAQ